MEIKVIPYEDKEKYCTHFFLANTKEDIIARFVSPFNAEKLNFSEIKELINLLDKLNMEDYKQRRIVIQTGKTHCEFAGKEN